jgi:quinoprotein glucose dehydrogenase
MHCPDPQFTVDESARRRPLKTCLKLIVVWMLLFYAGNAYAERRAGGPFVGDRPQQVEDEYVLEPDDLAVENWVTRLEVPWSLVFLKGGRALVSERQGRIRMIQDGRLAERPYATLDVAHEGEGGLMGLALHPRFPEQPFVYAMHTYRDKGNSYNRVIRLRDQGNTGILDRVVVDGIPGARFHNGGRIAFGPDEMLYVCTGDATRPEIAQDMKNFGGKILRLTPEGEIPGDNPFQGSPIYSLGLRNPQGLAWHPRTRALFASDHGPSGEFGLRGKDSIKVIRKGGNYGWPVAIGKTEIKTYIEPLVMWDKATPPGGIAFLGEDLYVATMRSETLIRIRLGEKDAAEVEGIERLFARDANDGIYGRLRDVVRGPDGNLYVLTTNRDGRGKPGPQDDRILRLKSR